MVNSNSNNNDSYNSTSNNSNNSNYNNTSYRAGPLLSVQALLPFSANC